MTRAESFGRSNILDRSLYSETEINGRKYRYYIDREYEKILMSDTKYYSCYAEFYNENHKVWREVRLDQRQRELYKRG